MLNYRNSAASLLVAASAGLAVVAAAIPAVAVELPCRAVRLIIPANPGGGTDTISRLLADAVGRQPSGPTIQVVNVGGQATMKGSIEAAGARPDGCTLLINHESLVLTYLTAQGEVTYTNFEPVARLTSDASTVTASPGSKLKDFEELAAHAKAHPGETLVGATLGGTSHLSLLMVSQAAGFTLKYVSYNGMRDRLTAMLGNHIQLTDVDTGIAAEAVKNGELVPLLVLGEERNALLPDVPTAKEKGIDLVFGLTHGLFVPKGTSREIVDFYAELFKKALQDPQVTAHFAKTGTKVAFEGPDAFRQQLDQDFARYKGIIGELGMLDMRAP